ncbi:chemotaxis protein CheB [Ferruginibacter sp. HRS2-29]|uniref:chemotaxis protein CheB n=1 Tax=Ferruginibacter sp. HRS2-29 TaxID=2487334 RepID=UPI0020CF6F1A|nr:chemotaxis protein CheB [Ferruginibacter sp. HRS2-29]MCP9749725.1 chemotaxis protein CheB [Ferruginibacter sp. HRS2-29]
MEKETMTSPEKLIVIGGSSGSLEVLMNLLPLLGKRLPVPVIIVLHRNNQSDNGLVELFASKTKLTVKEADEKDILVPGTVYIAAPDYHLLIEQDKTLSLDASAKVNFSRPSIDVTFSSAADVFGKGLTAILLSGANADGADAMIYVKECGGKLIVQDPDEALVGYMPRQAIEQNDVDMILGVVEIAEWINTEFRD